MKMNPTVKTLKLQPRPSKIKQNRIRSLWSLGLVFETFDHRDKNLYISSTAFSNSPVFLESKKYDYDTKPNLLLSGLLQIELAKLWQGLSL